MMKVALVGLAVMGLTFPAMGQVIPPRDTTNLPETRQLAQGSGGTLADCQVWLDQLGELIDEADAASVSQDVKQEAESSHESASQACDDGRYDEGITEAKEAIDKIEAETEASETET